ncbi:ABC transporter permease [Citrobacter farmeri]|nr:ABC transporter permease [Raoultella planticola]EKX4572311.1 ABC transporter permease [Enterobacter hormaechei]EKZ9443189.1 ABC transporter permease [Enterobacter hormaechei]ELJ2091310.1 ABC transporter permease [Enterobacter hormaechei]MDU2715697.1 ABC transporter permease [Klebsiella michiganensis]
MGVFNLFKKREALLLALIVILSAVITSINPSFMTFDNITGLLKTWTVLGIFALGVMLVLLSGGFDVSFTAIAQVVQYVIVFWFIQEGLDNIGLAIVCSLLLGGLMGLLNGVLIYYFKITAIIVTIATNSLFYGTLYVVTQGNLIYDIPPSLLQLAEIKIFPMQAANGAWYGLSLVTCLWFILAIFLHFFLKNTVLGRSIFAVGGNALSAERVGFNLRRTTLFIYTFVGAVSGFASLIQVSIVQTVIPNSIVGSELQVIAAVVLGGASVTGGRGSVFGTLLGVLLFAILSNSLTLLKVSPYYYNMFTGLVILVSITLNALQIRRQKQARVRVVVE